MPSGPKALRHNTHQLRDEKREVLKAQLVHQRNAEAEQREEEKEWAQAEDASWVDSSDNSKTAQRQQREEEKARERFLAQAEAAAERGEVPDSESYRDRRGKGNFSSAQAGPPPGCITGMMTGMPNQNHAMPTSDKIQPSTSDEIEKALDAEERIYHCGQTQKYRPKKKDHDWERHEKRKEYNPDDTTTAMS